MRKLSRLLLAVAFAVGASARAGAVDLTLTGGSLGVSIGALPPITFDCQTCPVVFDVTNPGVGNAFTVDAGVFAGDVVLPTGLFTGVALINGLTIGNLANGTQVINAAGAIAGPRTGYVLRPGNGNLGGPGPLGGSAFVNIGNLFNLTIPLNVIGATGASTAAGSPTGIYVVVQGTGWTTGSVMLNQITTDNPTPPPAVTNTVTYTGDDGRAASCPAPPAQCGVVQLISPFHVFTNAAGNLPGLAIQTLTFVPEPGSILLLVSGVVTLGIGGWLRMRRK